MICWRNKEIKCTLLDKSKDPEKLGLCAECEYWSASKIKTLEEKIKELKTKNKKLEKYADIASINFNLPDDYYTNDKYLSEPET